VNESSVGNTDKPRAEAENQPERWVDRPISSQSALLLKPFIAMNFLDPKYLAHLLGDWVPWPWELWDAFKS